MKALTIRQPHATLIALGVKTIETRSWRAPQSLIGQTIAIHAGKHRPKDVWCSASVDPVFPPPLARLYDYDSCVDPQESNDGEWWRYRWAGPLGAIVATATLADCVPMESLDEDPSDASLEHGHVVYIRSDPAWHGWALESYRHEAPPRDIDVSDQVPYGDFAPGRWAWMLDDVQPTTARCPACGRTPATPGMIRLKGPCDHCLGLGKCAPIPAKGKQGLWTVEL